MVVSPEWLVNTPKSLEIRHSTPATKVPSALRVSIFMGCVVSFMTEAQPHSKAIAQEAATTKSRDKVCFMEGAKCTSAQLGAGLRAVSARYRMIKAV